MLLALLLACSGAKDDTGEAASSITFLSPAAGATVPAGDVSVSVVVENFVLVSPAKHNEGEAEGYIAVSVDGAEVLQTGDTQFTVTLAAGAHTLGAELYYTDGDALDPAVSAEITVTAE
ncbi:MAG: hypothetical protein Q8P41_14965 [Pseudomonadota bacterium]|nr:hypothetical protein [Pseudomonadota bacterium]